MITRRMFDLPGMGWGSPFRELERSRREMERVASALYGGTGQRVVPSGVFPSLNVTEDADHFYVRAELPGIRAEDLELQVNANTLSISGERRRGPEDGDRRYHRRERRTGRFSRVIGLPGDIDADKVSATMSNGNLQVSLGKSEATRPRTIAIN